MCNVQIDEKSGRLSVGQPAIAKSRQNTEDISVVCLFAQLYLCVNFVKVLQKDLKAITSAYFRLGVKNLKLSITELALELLLERIEE